MTIGAEKGEIAEIGSPVLLAPAAIDHRHPWRWTSIALALAAALLALGDAEGAVGWVDELPPGPVAEALRGPVQAWSDGTARWGLDRPARWLRGEWKQAQRARFGNENPGEAGANDAP